MGCGSSKNKIDDPKQRNKEHSHDEKQLESSEQDQESSKTKRQAHEFNEQGLISSRQLAKKRLNSKQNQPSSNRQASLFEGTSQVSESGYMDDTYHQEAEEDSQGNSKYGGLNNNYEDGMLFNDDIDNHSYDSHDNRFKKATLTDLDSGIPANRLSSNQGMFTDKGHPVSSTKSVDIGNSGQRAAQPKKSNFAKMGSIMWLGGPLRRWFAKYWLWFHNWSPGWCEDLEWLLILASLRSVSCWS